MHKAKLHDNCSWFSEENSFITIELENLKKELSTVRLIEHRKTSKKKNLR